MRADCYECDGTGRIKRRPIDGGDYPCPECEASGNFFFTLVSRKPYPNSKRRKPHVVVGDCLFEIDEAFREGARAVMGSVPYHFNPYREDSIRHEQWNYGHELAGLNPVLAEKVTGRFRAEEIW